MAAAVQMAGCTSIRETRGYVIDQLLVESIQPGIDNQRSVEATLGRPSFAAVYGDPAWYYISSLTEQKPFSRPKIRTHRVIRISFDDQGNVIDKQERDVSAVANIDPDGDKTPTLGRERGFFQDLFGNIGTVGAPGAGAGAGPGG